MEYKTTWPIPAEGQTELSCWNDPQKWKVEKKQIVHPIVFLEPCSFGDLALNKVYFLKEGATYWHYIMGIVNIAEHNAEMRLWSNTWISIDDNLPSDGEKVHVKTNFLTETKATFLTLGDHFIWECDRLPENEDEIVLMWKR